MDYEELKICVVPNIFKESFIYNGYSDFFAEVMKMEPVGVGLY